MKCKMYTFLLIIFFWSTCLKLSGQCLNPTFIPASTCENAIQISQFFNENVEEICFNNIGQPFLSPPLPFCTSNSVLGNPSWYSVVSVEDGFCSMLVTNDNCSGGIQWAVYDQCHNLMFALSCQSNPIIPENEPFEILWMAEAQTQYYIVIDGANSSTCNFYLKDFVNIGCLPLGEVIDDRLIGLTNVCPAATTQFSFGGVQYAYQYHWSLDGISIGTTTDPSIEFTIPENLALGTYSLCVSASNICDSLPIDLCWDINISDEVNNVLQVYLCNGDSTYSYKDTLLTVGNHHFIIDHETSCTESLYILIQNSEPTYGEDMHVYVCEGSYYYHNASKLHPREEAYLLTYTNYRGCDSLVNLYVHEIHLDYEISTSSDYLGCDSSAYAVLGLEITGSNTDIVVNNIKWYDPNNNITNDTVYSPGKYYAVVNAHIPPVDNLPNSGEVCNLKLPIDILSDNPSLVAPIIKEDKILCHNGSGALIVGNHHADVTHYEWTIEGRTIKGGYNILHAMLGNLDTGWHQVKVQPFDDCGPGEASLYDFYLIKIPEIKLESSYSVYGKEIELIPEISGIEGILDYVSYKWSCISHNNVIFNPDDQLITTATVPEYGTYIFEVELTLNDFCKVRKSVVVIFSPTIRTQGLSDGISNIHPIYPNPTSNEYVISFETVQDTDMGIDLRDINGKIIDVIKPYGIISKGGHHFSSTSNHLPAGVYNIVYTTSKGIKTQRLILIR